MHRTLLIIMLGLLSSLGAMGCSGELEAFCAETTAAFCERCYECAKSDREGSNRCGLATETNKEGCQIILNMTCVSDAEPAYSKSIAEECRKKVDAMSCSSEGKDPEITKFCGKLF